MQDEDDSAHVKIALSSASTSPPALRTACSAASLSFFRLSLASCSRRCLVLELPLGATSLSSLLASFGVKLTKSIWKPSPGVFGVFGVRGGRDVDRWRGVSPSLTGPDLWIDFRRCWLASRRLGDLCLVDLDDLCVGDMGGEGLRDRFLALLCGVVNGELSGPGKLWTGGGNAGYDESAFV